MWARVIKKTTEINLCYGPKLFISREIGVFGLIFVYPVSFRIAHPYAQHYLTQHWGGSRITMENWRDQFSDEVYLEFFRFKF